MELDALRFIRDALPAGRTLYYDFPDRYAVLLLQLYLGTGKRPISDIKASPLAPLLNKPCIAQLTAGLGKNWLCAEDLLAAWPSDPTPFKLSLGVWPDEHENPRPAWAQVTRRGWNLVLQLNVISGHKAALNEDIPEWEDYQPAWHPVAGRGELTLAWARLDVDLESGEALVEEIQSDWVRDVDYYARAHRPGSRAWRSYRDATLKPYVKKWPETMLTAALWFLFDELGMQRVFYHTHHSGSELKQIRYRKPPQSLYRELPRRLCFRQTHNGPAFIAASRDRHIKALFTDPETRWFVLDFGTSPSD